MSVRLNFINWLLDQPPVTELAGRRVWPLMRPGGTEDILPCLVVKKRQGSEHLDFVVGTSNVRKHVFQISILAARYEWADELFVVLAGHPTATTGILSGSTITDMNGQCAGEVTVMDDYDGTDDESLFADGEKTFIITVIVGITTTTGE